MKLNINIKHGCLLLIFLATTNYSQQSSTDALKHYMDIERIQYNTPFKLQSIDSIKSILDRVKDYFVLETPFTIIDKQTKAEITDFSIINKDADVDNGDHNLFNLWTYEMGVTYDGLMKSSEVTGDQKYYAYTQKCFQFFFDHLPYFRKIDSANGITYNSYRSVLRTKSLDDCGSMGAALIKMYKHDNDQRYLESINHIADYIYKKQFRLKDGLLARERPQKESIWLDDAYMSVPLLAQMGSLTSDKKYFDYAVKQVLLFSGYLFKKDKRLFDHGFNVHNANDPEIFWARANGWIVLAICELLDVLPANHKSKNEIVKIFRTHIQGLTECQGANGLWHNILDRIDSYEETSASAMFVYGIAHGINMGWIDQTFAAVAQIGWEAITKKVNAKGQVEGTCVGTSLEGSEVYYYQRPSSVYAAHGYGPVLLAGAEMIKLIQNNHLVQKRRI
jgi:unsaturated rhamnogalacturonyl hydrolase